MIIVFIIVVLIIALLLFLMFIILRRTVRIVNDQTKSYFVNKLQGYDDLIQDKENKLQKIDDLIKDREKRINEEENVSINGNSYAFDTNVIDLMNETDYQEMNVLQLNKKIDENFVVNYEELVKDFLSLCKDSNDYEFSVNLKKKFNSDVIYELKTLLLDDREKMIKELLDQKEYKVYDTYKLLSPVDDIDNFIDYLDQLVDLNNPKVLIMVGNKSENYDHLSKYIETVYNNKIYRGIKIIYRGKIYDFSLSERNV